MGYIKIITAILIWSSLGVFVRKIDMPNSALIFYPAVVAGAIQFLMLIYRRFSKGSLIIDSGGMSIFLLLLVPVAFLANSYTFYYAFRHTTIANAVMTHYTAPIFVALMAPLLLKEKIRNTTWLAIVLSSAGLLLIIRTANGSEMAPVVSEKAGIIAGVLSGLSYAVLMLTIRKIASRYSSIFITCIQNIVVAMLLFPFVITQPFAPEYIPHLFVLGAVHSTIAPILYVSGFRSVQANEAAVLGYFEPVGAILLAFIFFSEVPGMQALLGGLLIILSGYLIIKSRVA